MRGMAVGGNDAQLQANWGGAEYSGYSSLDINPTGFTYTHNGAQYNGSGVDYIYVAIARPHKPASELTATDLLESTAYTGNGSSNRKIGSSITADMVLLSDLDATSQSWSSYAHYIFDRVRGENVTLGTSLASTEVSGWADTYLNLDQQIGFKVGTSTDWKNKNGTDYVSHHFRRAPGFFDVVAYTGTGSARTVNHNLGAVPEMMWVKNRSSAYSWSVYHSATGATKYLTLNTNVAPTTHAEAWNDTAPTSSVFTVKDDGRVNLSGSEHIAYLFASVDGISKVGSYSGTGSDLTVDCGFSNGARLVIIKRTDSTGHWYLMDSLQGITVGNDPALQLNEPNAQDSREWLKPHNSGFIASDYFLTISGASYIFYAIA